MANTILLADDDQGVAATVGRLFGADCRVIIARDGLATLAGVSSIQRPVLSYADAVRFAGEMKGWLKSSRISGPSALAFDRRRGGI